MLAEGFCAVEACSIRAGAAWGTGASAIAAGLGATGAGTTSVAGADVTGIAGGSAEAKARAAGGAACCTAPGLRFS